MRHALHESLWASCVSETDALVKRVFPVSSPKLMPMQMQWQSMAGGGWSCQKRAMLSSQKTASCGMMTGLCDQ